MISGRSPETNKRLSCNSTYRLRYWNNITNNLTSTIKDSCNSTYRLRYWNATPVSTPLITWLPACCNSTYRLRYWNLLLILSTSLDSPLQQYLLFTVLKHRELTSFKHSFNYVATVLTACGIETTFLENQKLKNHCVATVLTACGMRRRVRGSRGVKRRWGPHISSPWPKGRKNKGDKVTMLTTYSMYQLNSINNPRVNHFDLLGGFVS